MGQDSRYIWLFSATTLNISFVVTLEKMGLRRSYDDHRHVDNRMELVRHRTIVVHGRATSYDIAPPSYDCNRVQMLTSASRQTIIVKSYDIVRSSHDSRTRSYDFTMVVCREAEVNIWTRLQTYDGCAISYDVVIRQTTMAQHRAMAVQWEHVKNMVQTSTMIAWRQERSYDVARWLHDTRQSRASQPGFLTWPKTAKTSYLAPRWLRSRITSHDYARFTPMVHDHPHFAHRRWSYDVLRPGVTIAKDISNWTRDLRTTS